MMLFFCIVLYEAMKTFDIVLKKYIVQSVKMMISVNKLQINFKFNGDIFLVRFDYQNQSDDDTTEV